MARETGTGHNTKMSYDMLYICYRLRKGYSYIGNFLFLTKMNKKLLSEGKYSVRKEHIFYIYLSHSSISKFIIFLVFFYFTGNYKTKN